MGLEQYGQYAPLLIFVFAVMLAVYLLLVRACYRMARKSGDWIGFIVMLLIPAFIVFGRYHTFR